MKVLDLRCAQRHVFEGWFDSESDFVSQCDRGLVTCPVCSDASITKMLSAPRLNLSVNHATAQSSPVASKAGSDAAVAQAAWLAIARQVMEKTDDVGAQFAEEARKIHYGESNLRAIRGQASLEQAVSLIEEGISIAPLHLPEAFKRPLQ